ncbi:hypothetical protein [Microbacterium sp. SS28]|uniref:hypothetical protein n=1 Tax=Microbacterium sp. SS28 TaxID=2919948 RepID=UPI001FAAD05C|nr:hypothetical protein [Microbacterium sp. SS28]
MTDQTPPPASAPAAPARRSHLGLIIGSIVGGVLLLGATFAGGAAVGWVLGSHHASGWAHVGPAFPGGPAAPDDDDRQLPDRRSDETQPNS